MNETKVEKISLADIRPSKTNPRKHFAEVYIAELGASIRQKGIIQPLTLRPDWCVGKSDEEVAQVNGAAGKPQFFEIVAGECRYRGAQVAELKEAPSIVRFLGDKETLEIQLIENIQRADLTPVEEADAYRRLLTLGHTVETIHERTGKDRKTIYGKLKMLRAPDFLLEALTKRLVGERVCELVGRIPIAEMREKAAREILRPGFLKESEFGELIAQPDQPMSYRVAAEHVQQHYMRSLSGAPFKLGDASLVGPMVEDDTGERTGGGACEDCPMRSGNSPLLAPGEIKRTDVCMNPQCFAAKCDAHFSRLQETAAAEGKKILSDAEAKDIFEADGSISFASSYVKLSEQPDVNDVGDQAIIARKKIPSWKKLIENLPDEQTIQVPSKDQKTKEVTMVTRTAKFAKPQIAIARDPRGRIIELVDRALAIEAVNLAAKQKNEPSIFDKKSARPPSSSNRTSSSGSSTGGNGEEPEWKKQDRKNRESAKQNFQITLQAMETLILAIEKRGAVAGFWPALIEASIDHAGHDGCWLICKVHELDPKAKNEQAKREGVQGAALEYGLSLTSESEQQAYLVELLISQRVKIYNSGSMGGIRSVECFKSFAKLYGVDMATVEKSVKAKKEAPAKNEKTSKIETSLITALDVLQAKKSAPHDWEHIVDTKYRCRGCGAAAVKHKGKMIEEKAVRGKPCALCETDNSAPKKRKAPSAATKAKISAGRKAGIAIKKGKAR